MPVQQLTAEQLANAKIIADTGTKLGANIDDIVVAIMAALQESSLYNLPGGDRDSAGLFQERPSQGWGTYAQVTDPVYASTQFFNHLFAVPNRASLPLGAQAQAVERSAFPDAYDKWKDTAIDAVNTKLKVPGGLLGGISDVGKSLSPPDLPTVLSGIADTFKNFGQAWANLPKVFDLILKLSDPTTWVRGFAMMFGIGFTLIGLILLGRELRG